MERLTMKNSDGTYSQPTHLTFEKMFYKLAEFEDFMEEQDFESLQLLKAKLKMKTQSIKGFEKLYQENQALKDRWEKLKEFVKHEQICVDDGFQEVFNAYIQVLDKMQELEDRQ
jgi:hypothetical protein